MDELSRTWLNATKNSQNVTRHKLSVIKLTAESSDRLFEGVIVKRDFPSGFEASANDLLALRHDCPKASLPGQFVIRIPYQSIEVNIGTNLRKAVLLHPGTALAVAASDDISLAGTFLPGRRYRDFFIRIHPETLIDDELCERIQSNMRGNYIDQFPVDPSLCRRAYEICNPVSDSLLGGLFA